jgi:hypothetical protein
MVPFQIGGLGVLNFALLKNPANWVTVTLMVLIAGVAFHLVMRHWQNN